MSNKTIANARMEFIDAQYGAITMQNVFSILAYLSQDAYCSNYDYEKDLFLAQYEDRSYIIVRDILSGMTERTDFEAGVLNETGWKKVQELRELTDYGSSETGELN